MWLNDLFWGKRNTFVEKLSLLGDEWSPLRALSACGQILHKNPGKGQTPLPPFRQCLNFGNIWTGHPSLSQVIRRFFFYLYFLLPRTESFIPWIQTNIRDWNFVYFRSTKLYQIKSWRSDKYSFVVCNTKCCLFEPFRKQVIFGQNREDNVNCVSFHWFWVGFEPSLSPLKILKGSFEPSLSSLLPSSSISIDSCPLQI